MHKNKHSKTEQERKYESARKDRIKQATDAGWLHHEVVDLVDDRQSRSAENKKFDVLTRKSPRWPEDEGKIGVNFCGKSDLPQTFDPTKPPLTSENASRSLPPLGLPVFSDRDRAQADAKTAPEIGAGGADFGSLASMKAMSTGREGIVVGFDTEFVIKTAKDGSQHRLILSWQFFVVDPADDNAVVEVVILPESASTRRIGLMTALWAVVVSAGLYEHPLVADGVTAQGVARPMFWSDDPKEREESLSKFKIPLVLACHTGTADLTTFNIDGFGFDHLTRLTSAGGGLFSLFPLKLRESGLNSYWHKALSVTVVDTMTQAPAGSRALKILGETCGVPKIKLPDGVIEKMDKYRDDDFLGFLEYGINDARIVVEYLSRLWGDSMVPPVTISSGSASALVVTGTEYFGLEDSSEFPLAFAGLVNEDQGLDVIEEGDKLSFYKKRGKVPYDGASSVLMKAFASSYHGGMNTAPRPGFYSKRTSDVDAASAYPTVMSLVEDVDWQAGAIEEVFHERVLTEDDVPSPMSPVSAFVSFEFPESVKFPSIPVLADGTLVYPRTSEGLAGAWVAGPELWLALQLGATVTCQIGYRARLRKGPDDGRSLSLRFGVKQLIDDRRKASKLFGKKSLEAQTLKTAVNSLYGKTAQDVSEQKEWNSFAQAMENVGGSKATSPYHASMTTSGQRAELLSVMNELEDRGFRILSATTDGFITDAPIEVVESMPMYGFAEYLREAREFLSGEDNVWEVKHFQDQILNFTTRGNVAPTEGGVLAHNSLRPPEGIEEDSLEDRQWVLNLVATREGRVPNSYVRFPSFQELSRVENRKDFLPIEITRHLSMDYDLKRRPLFETMEAVEVPLPDGGTSEVATFDTAPWETAEEAIRARSIAREIAKNGALRTVQDWDGWRLRYEHGKGRRIVTTERAKLMSLVMAHRQGLVNIPNLGTRKLSVSDKIGWLSSWGLGTVSRGDWDNARRPERVSQMLPLEELEPTLSEMIAMPIGDFPDGVV